MCVYVKIGQRQTLGMGEQVGPDFAHHLLGDVDHQLIVEQTGHGSGQIDDAHYNYHTYQTRDIPGNDVGVDDRF